MKPRMMKQDPKFLGRLMIYRDAERNIKVNAILKDGEVWTNAAQFAELFQTVRSNISTHLINIFSSKELDEKASVKMFFTTTKHKGNSTQTTKVKYYNLKVAMALGYRINSDIATDYRIWCTEKLYPTITKDPETINVVNDKPTPMHSHLVYVAIQLDNIAEMELDFVKQCMALFYTTYNYKDDKDQDILFRRIQVRFRNTDKAILKTLIEGYLALANDMVERGWPMYMDNWSIIFGGVLDESDDELIKYNVMLLEETINSKIELYNGDLKV